MKKVFKANRKSGFTLVEIMIVVAVIALLSAISIPNLMRSRVNANEAAAISMLKTLVGLANSYRAVNPTYPEDISVLVLDIPPYMAGDAVAGASNEDELEVRKQGYAFSIIGYANEFDVAAVPQTLGVTGNRSFFSSASGQIFQQTINDRDPVPLE